MPTYTVTGNDTLVLGGRVFNDFATDDTTTVSFPNEIANIKTGKNGNSLVAQNMQGYNGQAVIKLGRGSSDDQFLSNQLAQQTQNFVGTQLIGGSFTKKMGDGQGNIVNDVYSLGGGVISKIPEAKDNASGDVTQAEVVYTIKFCNCSRQPQ